MKKETQLSSHSSKAMQSNEEKRIANKKHIWHWIKRGVIMQLHFDFETSGIDRSGMSHSIRGYPFITEYGDALGDISGNYINSTQILPKRPEWLIGDPPAPIVQRLAEGMEEYDQEDRVAYFDAMAQIAHRFEQAAFLYPDNPDERITIKGTDINKQARTKKTIEEEVIPIPLKLDDETITYDVRYHPERQKISYRFDSNDTNSPYYENIDNLYYTDENGEKWKWVDPSLKISGFNVKGYDIVVLRTNMARAGMHPKNIPFIYSRATISNKQRSKNYLCDERHTALHVALHGPHGEHGLQMGELKNPLTNKMYQSESLGAYFKSNQYFPNNIRMVKGGIFLANNEIFDPQDAHGGIIDSIGSLALNNYLTNLAPDIVSPIEQQSDEQNCIRQLQMIDPSGSTAPLFSLPRHDFPSAQSDSLYLFLDTDNQLGNFKQFLFFHMNGNLRSYTFNGKNLHNLNVDEWEDLYEKTRHDPDKPVRVESFRRWKGGLPYDFVLRHSKEAARYRDKLDDIDKDFNYLREHPEMLENIKTALSNLNSRRRFSPGVQNPLMEDEWVGQGFGDIYYQEQSIRDERRAEFLNNINKKGPRKVVGIVETIKSKMQDHYDYLNTVDEALMRIFVTAHPIDAVSPDAPDAPEILENYIDLCKRAYTKLRHKNAPQLRLMGSYFMRGGTPKFKTIEAAKRFRDAMRVKAMEDYLSEMEQSESFALGLTSTEMSKSGNKLLFSNPDRGERGGTPHIVDNFGREIPVSYIQKQKISDVVTLLHEKKWTVRFYRLRSEPIIDTIIKYCVSSNKKELIPNALYKGFYEPRRQLSLYGPPNEDANTARYSNLQTAQHQQNRLEINAKIRDQRLLERPNIPGLGEAQKLIKYEEGQRILTKNKHYLEKIKRNIPYKKTLVSNMQFDPKSGLPYDYIHHIIDKNNHVIIDVPAWHLRHPIQQYDLRLPPSCLVLPQIKTQTRKKIENGSKVILREQETGRLFHPGPVSIHTAPPQTDNSFTILNETAQKAYTMAQQTFPPDKSRIVLGIEKLYPVANTRNVNAIHQTLRLPALHFDGLTYPQISGLNTGEENQKPEPLKGVVIPANYCSQKLEIGKQIQLRETTDNMFKNINGEPVRDTGHIYETKLRKTWGVTPQGDTPGIKIKDLFNKISTGEIDQKTIQACGFLNKDHMETRLREWANKTWKNNFMEQHVLLLTFDKVRKESWAYFNPTTAPEAAMTENNKPVPPSAYQKY